MLFNKRHVRFLLKEEAKLIDKMRMIEMTFDLSADDEATIETFNNDFINRDLDLYQTTFKQIELMFERHGVPLPVDSAEQQRYHGTGEYHYISRGDGNFYPLNNKKSGKTVEERKFNRQTKRLKAWDKASELYNDIQMGKELMTDKNQEFNDRLKEIEQMGEKLKNDMRKAGLPVKAEVIQIKDYLPGSEQK